MGRVGRAIKTCVERVNLAIQICMRKEDLAISICVERVDLIIHNIYTYILYIYMESVSPAISILNLYEQHELAASSYMETVGLVI